MYICIYCTYVHRYGAYVRYSQISLVSTPGDPPNCYSLSVVLANHMRRLVLWVISWGIISLYILPNQVLLINSGLTNKVLLYSVSRVRYSLYLHTYMYVHMYCRYVCVFRYVHMYLYSVM